MSPRTIAQYARRLAHVPGALHLLRHHPDGLPLRDLAAELEVPEAQLREELEVFFLADVVDAGSVGLRSCALEFLAPGPSGGLREADLREAQVVRLTDDSPLDELGVEYLSPVEVAVLYRAAAELAALEPDNAPLRSALTRMGSSLLEGVDHLVGLDGGSGRHNAVAADLRSAAAERREVRLVYARAWRPGVVERVVHPYRVVSTRRGWEVDAGPLDADGQPRTYLVTGIRDHEVLDTTFERPDDAEERVDAARRPTTVRLVLPHERTWVVERYAERVRVVEQDEDGALVEAEFLPPVRERAGLVLTVAGGGGFAMDPPHVRDADQETARRLLEHHGLG